jgi:hypothetical protein
MGHPERNRLIWRIPRCRSGQRPGPVESRKSRVRSAGRPEQQFGSWPVAKPGRPALILEGAFTTASAPASGHWFLT